MTDQNDWLLVMLLGGRYQASMMLAMELRPRAVVCVASEDSVGVSTEVNALLRQLLPATQRGATHSTPPYDVNAALTAIRQARAAYPRLRPCISVTGAPVPMAVAGYQAAREWGCPAWYVNTRDGQVIDLAAPERSRRLQARLSVSDFLRLYNVQESPNARYSEVRAVPAAWLTVAHQLGTGGQPASDLLAWLRRDGLEARNYRKQWPDQFGAPHRALLGVLVQQHMLYDVRFSPAGRFVSYRVPDEQVAAFLRGGWLENYVWVTAEQLRQSGEAFDACQRGLLVRLGEAEREIDLIAVGRGLALVASCKATRRPWDKSYLDEVAAVANLLGGNYCVRLFITDQPQPVSEPGMPDRFQQFVEQARRLRVVLVAAHNLAQLAEVFKREMSSSPTYARL